MNRSLTDFQLRVLAYMVRIHDPLLGDQAVSSACLAAVEFGHPEWVDSGGDHWVWDLAVMATGLLGDG